MGHVLADTVIMLDIRHLQISYKTPCLPPKIVHNLCFSFLLGITAVPREIKNKVHCGRFASVDQAQLAVLIHSLLRAPALFSFRLARRSVIFKAKRK